MASPEEMLQLALDQNLEADFNNIIENFLSIDLDENYAAYSSAFPGITRNEYAITLFKIMLIASLGSGEPDYIGEGLSALEAIEEIKTLDIEELPEEIQEVIDSNICKDLIAFYDLFDLEAFFAERYPDLYQEYFQE